jgi:hypothetical protein
MRKDNIITANCKLYGTGNIYDQDAMRRNTLL